MGCVVEVGYLGTSMMEPRLWLFATLCTALLFEVDVFYSKINIILFLSLERVGWIGV